MGTGIEHNGNTGESAGIDSISDNEKLNKSDIGKKIENLNMLLFIMEDMFDNNQSEVIGYLDEEDIFDGVLSQKIRLDNNIDKSSLLLYKGESIENIMSLCRKSYNEIAQSGMIEDENDYNTFSKASEQYLKMQVGIGDKYEGGAALFDKSDEEVTYIVSTILLSHGTPEKMLQYLQETHEQIDSNNFQSSTVEKTYKKFSTILSKQIFEMFQVFESMKGITDKNYLELAKIVAGKSDNNIDANLTDPQLANEIIYYTMYRNGGLINRLEEHKDFKIEDKEIGDTDLGEIYNSLLTTLNNKFPTVNGKEQDWGEYMQFMFDIDSENSTGRKYSELEIDEKIKFTFLSKLNNKLHETLAIGGPGTAGHFEVDTEKKLLQALYDMQIDAKKQVNNEFEDNFDTFSGKDAKDFGLEGELDNKIIDFFNEVNGSGFFDLSDQGWEVAKGAGKIGSIIGLSLLTGGLVGGGVIAQGVAMGAASSFYSNVLTGKGFDSQNEATIGIASDFALGIAMGGLGGKIVQDWGKEGALMFSKEFLKNGKVIMAGDLAILSMLPEYLREKLMGKNFVTQEYIKQVK